ncbi:hypothetical protein Tco_0108292, partial [Tanacetum coccineum]
MDHEDLEQLDEFDLEEMDLKLHVAMISIRLKKFYKMTGRRLQFDAKDQLALTRPKLSASIAINKGTLLENTDQKEIKKEPKALVTLDGEGVDLTGHAEDEQENFALMAYSNSGLDTKVTLGDASIEIQAYTQALAKVKAQLVAHQKNQL